MNCKQLFKVVVGIKLRVTAMLCCVAIHSSVQATVYRMIATGRVVSARLHDYATNSDSDINGLINVGNAFNVSSTFDTEKVNFLYDPDPTVNVYFLSATLTQINSGNYSSVYSPRFSSDSSVQFWNDRDVAGPTDSQSFQFQNTYYGGPYPFVLNKGSLFSESVSIYAFDYTHTVRNSDLITEINSSSSAFNSNSMSYSFYSADGGNVRQGVFLTIDSVIWSISVIPEPTSWVTMILGLGLIGIAMRRVKLKAMLYYGATSS